MSDFTKRVYRNPIKGRISGVCAGLADYFDIDVVLMRVLFIVGIFATGGAVILLYIILAIVLPVEGKHENFEKHIDELGHELRDERVAGRARNMAGIVLLVLGVWLLLGEIFPFWYNMHWGIIWPLLLVLFGILIITRKNR
jgi:phage shock protein PspC (stress-responsive transcriptional regulator)